MRKILIKGRRKTRQDDRGKSNFEMGREEAARDVQDGNFRF